MGLIEKLQERQGKKSQAVFAAELGISQPQLSRIYTEGRRGRQITRSVGKRILRRYPDLQLDVAQYLLADDPTNEVLVPTGT